MTPNTSGIEELARAALADEKSRTKDRNAGSMVWRKREPMLAHALMEALGIPQKRSVVANLNGEIRLLSERVAELSAEVASLRFERDRATIAHRDACEVIQKLMNEYVSPDWLDTDIRNRVQAVCS